jgi:hypothetical protein
MRSSSTRFITDGVRKDRGALEEAGQDSRLEPKSVEERIDDEVAVAFLEADDAGPAPVGAHARTVGQHRSLREAGCARGEQDVAQIIGLDVGGAISRGGPCDAGRADQELGPRDRVRSRRPTHHDDVLEVGELASIAEHGDVVGVEEVGDREQHSRARRGEDVRGLGSLETRVERNQNAGAAVDRTRRDHPFRHVLGPDGDAVARFDSNGDERSGGDVDVFEQLDPCEMQVAVDQRLLGRETSRGSFERSRNGCG